MIKVALSNIWIDDLLEQCIKEYQSVVYISFTQRDPYVFIKSSENTDFIQQDFGGGGVLNWKNSTNTLQFNEVRL